jgi:acyl-CoA thioester hydrolase
MTTNEPAPSPHATTTEPAPRVTTTEPAPVSHATTTEPAPLVVTTEPAPHVTRIELVVRFCETDLMGIVHHANYLQYFEAGRVAWLKARGVAYDAWVKAGMHLPVVEADLRYKRAARFDDALAVDTWVGALGRASVRFDYRIALAASPDAAVCEGTTLLACVDAALRPRRLPREIEALFRDGLAPPSPLPRCRLAPPSPPLRDDRRLWRPHRVRARRGRGAAASRGRPRGRTTGQEHHRQRRPRRPTQRRTVDQTRRRTVDGARRRITTGT